MSSQVAVQALRSETGANNRETVMINFVKQDKKRYSMKVAAGSCKLRETDKSDQMTLEKKNGKRNSLSDLRESLSCKRRFAITKLEEIVNVRLD